MYNNILTPLKKNFKEISTNLQNVKGSIYENIVNPITGNFEKIKTDVGKFVIEKYKDQLKNLSNVVQISGSDTLPLYECEKDCGFKSDFDSVVRHEKICQFCRIVDGVEECCEKQDEDCEPCGSSSLLESSTNEKELEDSSPKSPTFNEWSEMNEKDREYWGEKANKRVVNDYQEYIDEYEKMEYDLYNSYSNSDGKIRRFQGESDELNFLYKLKELLHLKHRLWISVSRQFGYLGNIERPEPGYGNSDGIKKKSVQSWPVTFKNNNGRGYFTNSSDNKQLQAIEILLLDTAEKIENLWNEDFPDRNNLTPPLPEEIKGLPSESFFENLSPLPGDQVKKKHDLKDSAPLDIADDDSDDDFLGY